MKLKTSEQLAKIAVGWGWMILLGALWYHGVEWPAVMFISGHVLSVATSVKS